MNDSGEQLEGQGERGETRLFRVLEGLQYMCPRRKSSLKGSGKIGVTAG